MKKIIVKHDFKGTGIWELQGGSMNTITYEELNLSPVLSKKFCDWQSWYWDSFYDPDDFPFEKFIASGMQLAGELEEFLGEKYQVEYKGNMNILEIKNELERLKCVNNV